MNERLIQHTLWMKNHSTFSVLLPNYTPDGWWECDMFGVTKAGYFHEFEIKVSVSDFRADVAKRKNDYSAYEFGKPVPQLNKHEQLALRSISGPALFWYCVPDDLLTADQVPEWAGLQAFSSKRGWPHVIKQAPRLHREKIDSKVVSHALRICYHRYWNERHALDRVRASIRPAVSLAEEGGGDA